MAKVITNKDAHKSDDKGFFPAGGKTKMFGKGTSFTAESGVSGKSTNKKGEAASETFAQGGNGHMFDKGHAGHKVAGISGKASQSG